MHEAAERSLALTADEASAARETLRGLRKLWRFPGGDRRVAIVGLPSYELGPTSPRAYRAQARAVNAVLEARFSWLYERLLTVLEPLLNARHAGPVSYSPDRARPGFHVLVPRKRPGDPRAWLGSPHWDAGFLKLHWRPPLPPTLDISSLASFTLPLALPRTGGGLRVWPVSSAMVKRVAQQKGIDELTAMKRLLRRSRPSVHRYRVGQLFMHTGHLVHEVMRWRPSTNDERVTLQGHALHAHGRWHVYW